MQKYATAVERICDINFLEMRGLKMHRCRQCRRKIAQNTTSFASGESKIKCLQICLIVIICVLKCLILKNSDKTQPVFQQNRFREF